MLRPLQERLDDQTIGDKTVLAGGYLPEQNNKHVKVLVIFLNDKVLGSIIQTPWRMFLFGTKIALSSLRAMVFYK